MAATDKHVKTAVVGRGCIATTLAYYLNDPELHLLVRNAQETPLEITYQREKHAIPGKLVALNTFDFADIDLLLVPIKSYHNEAFINEAKDKLPTTVTIAVFQNGIQFVHQFKRAFPQNAIIAGLSTDGAYRDERANITLAGKGTLVLGSISQAEKKTVNQLLRSHPSAQWLDDIDTAIFKKLLINIAINPLTFVHQCKNGELMKRLHDVNAIVNEVFVLFDKLQVQYQKDTWFEEVISVIKGTANNTSSMLQDRLKQQPTEIDAILGALLEQAFNVQSESRAGGASNNRLKATTDTPFISALYDQVTSIEQQYLSSK
ncbi:MAG: 2-dehydropantoate 2-reductase [Pseudomonadota bacterium]